MNLELCIPHSDVCRDVKDDRIRQQEKPTIMNINTFDIIDTSAFLIYVNDMYYHTTKLVKRRRRRERRKQYASRPKRENAEGYLVEPTLVTFSNQDGKAETKIVA